MKSDFPILLIDDDPDLIRILTQAALSSFPEARFDQVHNTADAQAHFSKLTGRGPKLVLLDIQLGDKITGLDFLALLRADRQTRLLPVVMLTVSELPSDIQDAYASGVSSFTNKPSTYDGWVTYLGNLRSYWLHTVTPPPSEFRQQE